LSGRTFHLVSPIIDQRTCIEVGLLLFFFYEKAKTSLTGTEGTETLFTRLVGTTDLPESEQFS
jgi:hypothetical protein